MPTAPRSFYLLELSVAPGGSRWAELHAYTDPRPIHRVLKKFCKNEHGFPAYHALFYGGAVLGIWVVQRSTVVKFIDLHRYITARLGRAEPLPLSRKLAVKRMLAAQDDDGDELCRRIKLGLAWDEVAARLPALVEPRLAPGESCAIARRSRVGAPTYRRKREVQFGSVDLEA